MNQYKFDFFSSADNSPSVLLASDVAARGLDIRGVDHVVHYQVPFTVEVRNINYLLGHIPTGMINMISVAGAPQNQC